MGFQHTNLNISITCISIIFIITSPIIHFMTKKNCNFARKVMVIN